MVVVDFDDVIRDDGHADDVIRPPPLANRSSNERDDVIAERGPGVTSRDRVSYPELSGGDETEVDRRRRRGSNERPRRDGDDVILRRRR